MTPLQEHAAGLHDDGLASVDCTDCYPKRHYRITVETVKRTFWIVKSDLDLRQAPPDAIFEHHGEGWDEDGYEIMSETIVDVEDVEDTGW